MKREAGPGMPRGVREPEAKRAPWWFDYGTCEVVRASDGRRWDVSDVPELHRSARAMNAVDVAEVDRWVLAQPGKG